MREVETLFGDGAALVEIGSEDRESRERMGAQPRGEIWLDGDTTRLADFGHIGGDRDDTGIEVYRVGCQFGDLAVRDAGANSGKEAKREAGDPAGRPRRSRSAP
jgi:hypothetical protein